MKIAVAMSGGVDSSVAAALLVKQGHEVIGVTMQLRPLESGTALDTAAADAVSADARKVAEKLGIPHHVLDLRRVFKHTVIDYFCREYTAGGTPNPCVLCNRQIKFGALWEKARELGAEFLATGHYAAVTQNNGRFLLKKGSDLKKDQSYFLYRLTQEQLSRTLFPLAVLTKDKVKDLARELELPTAFRPESQEICFVPDNDYAGFLKEYYHAAVTPGPILDRSGNTLGEHRGIINYTIGQRKGLGIASPEPLYVTGIDAVNNTITAGTKGDIYAVELAAGDLNWIAYDPPDRPVKVAARVRYRHEDIEAVITPINEHEIYVKFSTPQMAVTPGQSVVFYEEDTVIGGGTILRQGR
jgi:tRNA-specific 2-thiouridylase